MDELTKMLRDELPYISEEKRRAGLHAHFIQPGYEENSNLIKFSFDLHGVIDAKHETFKVLMGDLIKGGREVHIVTGAPWEKERMTLETLGIPFTHFFSIVDFHKEIGTPIRWDDLGNAHIDEREWDKTKGLYCLKQKIDMHFDDSDQYAYFFKTPYTRFYSKDSYRIKKTHIGGSP